MVLFIWEILEHFNNSIYSFLNYSKIAPFPRKKIINILVLHQREPSKINM